LFRTPYERHRRHHKAAAKLKAVAQRHPGPPRAYEMLVKLYDDIGFEDNTNSAQQKTLELSEK
jgi:TolA-binding protein